MSDGRIRKEIKREGRRISATYDIRFEALPSGAFLYMFFGLIKVSFALGVIVILMTSPFWIGSII